MGGVVDFNYIFFGSHEKKRKIVKIIKLVAIFLLAGLVLYYGYRPIESTILQESETLYIHISPEDLEKKRIEETKPVEGEKKRTEQRSPIASFEVKGEYTNESRILDGFIKENINESYYPQSLEVAKINSPIIDKDIYGDSWTVVDKKISATVYYKNMKLDYMQLFINLPDGVLIDKNILQLSSEYFIDARDNFICKYENSATRCESIWLESGNKKTIVVFSKGKTAYIRLCEIPKESGSFDANICS